MSRADFDTALLLGHTVLRVGSQASLSTVTRQCAWDDLRGARQLGAEHRATYLYSVDPKDLNHDAVMRIGG